MWTGTGSDQIIVNSLKWLENSYFNFDTLIKLYIRKCYFIASSCVLGRLYSTPHSPFTVSQLFFATCTGGTGHLLIYIYLLYEEECRPGINPESMGVCRASCVVISRKFTLGNRGQFRCYIKLLFVCKWRTIATITCKRWIQATSHIIRYSEDPLSKDHHRHLEFMVPRSAQLLTHLRIS